MSRLDIYSGPLADVRGDGDLDIVGSRSYWTGPVYMLENEQSVQ